MTPAPNSSSWDSSAYLLLSKCLFTLKVFHKISKLGRSSCIICSHDPPPFLPSIHINRTSRKLLDILTENGNIRKLLSSSQFTREIYNIIHSTLKILASLIVKKWNGLIILSAIFSCMSLPSSLVLDHCSKICCQKSQEVLSIWQVAQPVLIE